MDNMIELLQKYPKAAKLVKEYYLEQLMKGLKEDLPEDFKQHVKEIGVDDEKIAKLMELNPLVLTELFDLQDIFVTVLINKDKTFEFYIYRSEGDNQDRSDMKYKSRLKAAQDGIDLAMSKLESKLS